MIIDLYETHDRLKHLQSEQSINLSVGADECLKKNPLSLRIQSYSPYVYLFAHPRTREDGRTKVMYWQPRLGKPKAQTNSYLFRAQSGTDIVEICWMIPPREMWPQYKKGNVTESDMVNWSIQQFQHNRQELEKPFPDDFSDEQIKVIYLKVAADIDQERMMDRIYTKPASSVAFSTLQD